MKMMRKGVLAAAIAAALLTACGGGSDNPDFDGGPSGAPTTQGKFTAVVSFGDSLSDVGTYSPATSVDGDGRPPYIGGKFTTNTDNPNGDLVWVERVAGALGLVVTPAAMGFNGQSNGCPAAEASPALATTCTAYGQGGSRITVAQGIGQNPDGSGALTVPVVKQIENHLKSPTFGGRFKDTDLIVVWAGNNDAFAAFQAFGVAAAAISAKYPVGTPSENYAEADRKALYDAQSAAQQVMKTAALDLARYVKDGILANGGKYVAVGNLPDSSLTPQFRVYPVGLREVLKTLTETFNLWLQEGLDGQPVRIIDMASIGAKVNANPAENGFDNVSVPACDIDVLPNKSSLFCNATPGSGFYSLRDGASAETWFFADGVHPSAGGHRYYAEQILQQLQAFGWIAQDQ